ncbi:hypothetical protein F5Y05DRAFT_409742 [Hypoxylon sp. FL0543]|nr:hypothetical protein F5Y05DRAFT_409742 [Hypoxylon sp. FL0543]
MGFIKDLGDGINDLIQNQEGKGGGELKSSTSAWWESHGTGGNAGHTLGQDRDSSSDKQPKATKASKPKTSDHHSEEPQTTETDDPTGNEDPPSAPRTTRTAISTTDSPSVSESSSGEAAGAEIETSDTTPAPSSPSPETAPTTTPSLPIFAPASAETFAPSSVPLTASETTPMTVSEPSSTRPSLSTPSAQASGGDGSVDANPNAHANTSSTANAQTVPAWAIPLMVIGIVMGLSFFASLAFFCIKEYRKKDGEARGGKKPSYARAVGKALTVATLLFIPIWIARRLRGWNGKRVEENDEGNRKYHEQLVEYAKLGEDQERDGEPEQGRDFAREQEDRRLEEGVVVVDRSGSPAPAPALAPPTTPVGRSPSMVSSLSSRSQGSHDRLENIVPSPVSEETPYVWRPQPRPSTQAGNLEDRGAAASADTGARRDSDIPSVLRPGGGG